MILSTDFLGYTLKNPLMLTEGPLSGTGPLIRKAADAGAGLIFTKGIRPGPVSSPVPYIRKYEGSLINADWSCIGLEKWLDTMKTLDTDVPVVTSVAKNYVTPEQAVEMGEALVRAGSKIISFVDYDPEQLIKTVRLARKKISVPMMVKLPPFLQRLEEVLKELVHAGIDAVAAMDSIGPVLSIDTENGLPVLGSADGSGYLSGKYILPVTLKYIYDISGYVDIPVVGVGGVTNGDGAVQMIMAGARGVGMVSAPMLRGLGVFRTVEKELEAYCRGKEISNVSGLCGLTRRLSRIRKSSETLRARIDKSKCTNCGACVKVCYAGAIAAQGNTHTAVSEICVGCGLCDSVCPSGAVEYIEEG